ncbi:MAG: hypothetical protein CL853_00895 [Crocinitomicaceae bacterium]|nr:hypothetical protein [Crocinitomicaceae bacterium]
MNCYFYSIIALFFVLPLNAQEETPCVEITDSKVLKLFEKAKNSKKYNYKERVAYFKEAIELDEQQCVKCMWELAKLTYRRAYSKGDKMDIPKKYFHQIEQLCPDYHADLYYYLSLIYYAEVNDCESKKYFKKFLDFPTDDNEKLSRNYSNQISSVELTLPVAEFYCDFYANPVNFSPFLLNKVSTATKNEFLPAISPDNELLYFTREYMYQAKGDVIAQLIQDFTVSERQNADDNFDSGKVMSPPFNVGPKYGGASISLNNKELYICACTNNGNYNNCDIFVSYLEFIEKGEVTDTVVFRWSELQNLGPNINGPQTWEAQPSLSADGKTLYFASARPGGKGSVDIYYSERQPDGSWGKAQNMGYPINTPESDKSPFIHTDSKTLYFVSKISEYRLGAGEFDIFYTRQDKKTGKWIEPQNIGHPINTEGDEEGIIVTTDGNYAYFSSERSDIGVGGKDIFYFSMPEKAKPDKVVLMKGKVETEDVQSLKDTKLEVRFKSGDVYEQKIDIDDDGSYVAIANIGSGDEDVVLEVKKEGKAFESKLIKKEESTNTFIENQELEIKDIEKGSTHTIEDILFETNSSTIDPSSKLVLEAFASWLNYNGDIKIEIQGHTDDVGGEDDNLALSKDRAFSVMEYLIELKVSASRLSFKGYGESQPKFENNSELNRSKNRRTDFLIL